MVKLGWNHLVCVADKYFCAYVNLYMDVVFKNIKGVINFYLLHQILAVVGDNEPRGLYPVNIE